jgi:PAP2 superfamily
VQTVGLTWQHSFEVAAVVGGLGTALAIPKRPQVRFVGAFLREAAVIGGLYGLWRLAGTFSLMGVDDAYARGRWIQRFEHDIGLPSERTLQRPLLDHPLLMHAANLYYATMHFTTMLAFLVWLFVRHRDRYRPVRQVMAWTTLGCLLVQLLPVAPPRMFPGFVDTGMVDGLSVYNNGLALDQMAAMPSVHVGWAVLVGWYACQVTTSGWRYLAPVHATLTVLIVAATANHWWLDGIVAVAILAVCAWGVWGVRTAWHALRARLLVAEARQLTEIAPSDLTPEEHVA